MQYPLTAWKFLFFPTVKSSDLFSVFMKVTLAIFVFLSAYLFFYHSFTTHIKVHSCPQCDRFITEQKFIDVVDTNNNNTSVNYEKTNLSHILFGIGGSTQSWDTRRIYSDLWWIPNITRGYVWLDEKPKTWPETSPPYKISEDTSSFKYSCSYGSRSAVRIARIVKESFELGLDNVRWFVLGDDDTVFFVENLITVLGKYDHNQMYYIGANSESIEQDLIHSYTMAYGGSGIAISYPLAAELVRVLDGCIDRYESFYGSDQKIQGCMAEIGVPLTKELGFHQVYFILVLSFSLSHNLRV